MRMVWSLVFLLGLLATFYLLQQGTLTMMIAEWVWFVVLIVGCFAIGKTYGKMPASATNAWMGAMLVFAVLVVTMLLGLWSAPLGANSAAVLFALYFLFTGGAMFASGHEMKNAMWMGWGLVNIALAIVFPSWFVATAETPFLAAALLIGLPMLYTSWKKM